MQVVYRSSLIMRYGSTSTSPLVRNSTAIASRAASSLVQRFRVVQSASPLWLLCSLIVPFPAETARLGRRLQFLLVSNIMCGGSDFLPSDPLRMSLDCVVNKSLITRLPCLRRCRCDLFNILSRQKQKTNICELLAVITAPRRPVSVQSQSGRIPPPHHL